MMGNCCSMCAEEAQERAIEANGGEITGAILMMTSVFIICPDCGNKRCPKATDHRLECTGSNEPGQKGSRYE